MVLYTIYNNFEIKALNQAERSIESDGLSDNEENNFIGI